MRFLIVIVFVLFYGFPVYAKDSLPPEWIKNAVIYGIKPSSFVNHSSYSAITRKLPEIKSLGVNTIWLQPVTKTLKGGQGYDVADYFSLRDDLGPEEDLKELIDLSHQLGMKVLFDFVPNHTSLQHPYAIDIIEKGKQSPYYDYYQHENDHVVYSSFYNTDENGFVYYFWKNLVNLNYHNDSVKKMITDACVFWIKKFNIDGYRFDASWGVRARNPEFFPALRKVLKEVKPDILLLAEDKGSDKTVFEQGFDVAYDWTKDTAWVSQWSWEYEHNLRSSMTMFNHPNERRRIKLIDSILFNGHVYNDRIVRYMENNDLPRFIQSHSLEQTKMAAALLFSLPGIPMLFGGQETGSKVHPYSPRPIYADSLTIRDKDSFGLFDLYKTLISRRLEHPSLRSSNIEKINSVYDNDVVMFRRWSENEQVVVIVNPGSKKIDINIDKRNYAFLKSTRILKNLTDQKAIRHRKKKFNITIEPFSTTLLLVND